MSDFKLDVESPYPIPEREKLQGKPNKVDYPQRRIKYGHYGKTIEEMIAIACDMETGDERDALSKNIASLMKRFHITFNSPSVEDEAILEHLAKMSDGQLKLTDTSFLPSTNEIIKSNAGGSSNKSKGKRSNKGKNRKNRKRH